MKNKTIVIKIGSGVIMDKNGEFDYICFKHLTDQVTHLHNTGYYIILVVSGAVASGLMTDISDHLHLSSITDISLLKQAAAGIGQIQLITIFNNIFKLKQISIAQILLDKSDLNNEAKRVRIRKVMKFYIKSGIIPVFNENDVVDLNSFGGNDCLSAEIAKLVKAERLIILSTPCGSVHGVGGRETKQKAVNDLNQVNIKTFITNGKLKNSIINHVV